MTLGQLILKERNDPAQMDVNRPDRYFLIATPDKGLLLGCRMDFVIPIDEKFSEYPIIKERISEEQYNRLKQFLSTL